MVKPRKQDEAIYNFSEETNTSAAQACAKSRETQSAAYVMETETSLSLVMEMMRMMTRMEENRMRSEQMFYETLRNVSRNNEQSLTEPRPYIIMPDTRDTVRKFLREITINGEAVNAMVDTGSIHPKIYGFGKETLAICYNRKANATIEIDGACAPGVEVFKVPNEAQPNGALVGRSFTKDANIAYARIDDKLVFGERNELPFKDLEIEETTQSPVFEGVNTENLQNGYLDKLDDGK
ncbi:hypothetical protein RN001_008711 [Aquatica leii]|uniref:Uncharacterized protein n=1 Tax=Aquatica leii TaxID=1421715 RepID=A0AAN7Q5C5_9COLE|nr:hypothetical protein RN001_008711 [Aquatica leii]